MKDIDREALEYHERPPRGKIQVVPTKPVGTQLDLSLAYTPGVAAPVRAIADDPRNVYRYTAKGNLVAVITNGTAVLGLGDTGPAAGKPVMEGKGVLFKRFADIDVFDLEVDAYTADEMCTVVRALAPTFGGINLEDISAPECFEIERRLREELDIPVFHDDQHGTAIIAGAGLLNALELTGRDAADTRVVFSGAGAAAIAVGDMIQSLGVSADNILMCDSKGVLTPDRDDLGKEKRRYARETDAADLADALTGADVFIGLSIGGIVSKDMVRSMADRPILFALANPDPEITPDDVADVRDDAVMATGRSDFPNQVNNVLGFPHIFRGALDVGATGVTEEMKTAAAHALAELAREDVPDEVRRAYGGRVLQFGPEYIIPKPLDTRVLLRVAPAVARAAMDSDVARLPITDWDAYHLRLERILGPEREIMRRVITKAEVDPRSVVFPEGEVRRTLRAAGTLAREGICRPILLGDARVIQANADDLGIALDGIEVVNPADDARVGDYRAELVRLRARKGVTETEARRMLLRPNYFGAMMVRQGHADGMVSGLTRHYPDVIRPALQVIGLEEGRRICCGVYMVLVAGRVLFLADTTVNIQPNADDLAEIALMAAECAERFEVTPRVAMLSFSDFGSARHPLSDMVREAVAILHERRPDLIVDGEMQADTAVDPEVAAPYDFSDLRGDANVLVFPDLTSGNVSYKLLERLADAECIGPMLQGMARPVNVLQRGAAVSDIVHMAAITVQAAQDA